MLFQSLGPAGISYAVSKELAQEHRLGAGRPGLASVGGPAPNPLRSRSHVAESLAGSRRCGCVSDQSLGR